MKIIWYCKSAVGTTWYGRHCLLFRIVDCLVAILRSPYHTAIVYDTHGAFSGEAHILGFMVKSLGG